MSADGMPSDRGSMAASEAGVVAGAEALVLGVLVFVLGTLVMVNAWAVVDAKFATSAAAREAVRAVVHAPADETTSALRERARRAAGDVFDAYGYDSDAVDVQPTPRTSLELVRCETIELEAAVQVRTALVPGIQAPGRFRVASRHAEVVEPFRSGLAEGDGCAF